jgi:hypothetical protein
MSQQVEKALLQLQASVQSGIKDEQLLKQYEQAI